jgi:hypothetical protein
MNNVNTPVNTPAGFVTPPTTPRPANDGAPVLAPMRENFVARPANTGFAYYTFLQYPAN